MISFKQFLNELTKTEAEADDLGRTYRFFKRMFTKKQKEKSVKQ